jgi:hypothetical protein
MHAAQSRRRASLLRLRRRSSASFGALALRHMVCALLPATMLNVGIVAAQSQTQHSSTRCLDDPTYSDAGWACAAWAPPAWQSGCIAGYPPVNTPERVARLVEACPVSCSDVASHCEPPPPSPLPPPPPLLPPPPQPPSPPARSPPPAAPPCLRPDDEFIDIRFNDSNLSYSNLGGLGGRCDAEPNVIPALLCTEGERSDSTPRALYIENVGFSRLENKQIDLSAFARSIPLKFNCTHCHLHTRAPPPRCA